MSGTQLALPSMIRSSRREEGLTFLEMSLVTPAPPRGKGRGFRARNLIFPTSSGGESVRKAGAGSRHSKRWRAILRRALSLFWMACCSGSVPAAEHDDPAAQLASFRIAEGFEVNLFASEKDGVTNPIQIRFDPRGRLFVACSEIYPQLVPGRKLEDRIVVLEDTDHDGRADRSSVFAEDLIIPSGIEWGDGGLYAGSGTKLLHLVDGDGDGRAEKRRLLLRGFGTGDSHQNINSFCWSPGGELMFSQGLHAFSDVETPWGIERLHEAGIWRWRPRRLRLDGFFGNGLAPHNPWGFVFGDWGEPFVVAGNGHGIFYLTPILIRDHQRVELGQIWQGHNGRKLCGADAVGTRHLPEEWQGTWLAGGFMNHSIFHLSLQEDGSGFRVTDLPPLLTSSHSSFRPVDVKIGPEGAIYVADWYNPIIGHYQASFRHPARDKSHGRIWRITAKGRPLAARIQLESLSTPELLEHLKSRERWIRYQTKRLLAERDTPEVVRALDRWIDRLDQENPACDHWLFEALGVFETHEVVRPELLKRLLQAREAPARVYAATVVGRWQDRLDNPLDLLAACVADEHPRVRLAAVVAAACVPSEQAIEVATAVLDRSIDPFLDYALRQAVYVLKPHWLPAFKAGRLAFGNRQGRLEFVLAADGSPDTFRSLLELLDSDRIAPPTRESFLKIVANAGDAEALLRLFKPETYRVSGVPDSEMQARVLAQLTESSRVRKARPGGDLSALLSPLVGHPNERLQAEAVKLAGLWQVASMRPGLEDLAMDKAVARPVRQAAMNSLGALGGSESRDVLVKLAGASQPESVRAMAITALTQLNLAVAARSAAELFAGGVADPLAEEVFVAFLRREKGAEALARASAEKKPQPDAAKIGLRIMSSSGRQDARLTQVLNEAAGLEGEPWRLSGAELEAFVAEVRGSGDPRRGETLFQRADLNCAACHAVAGQGGTSGPDLNAIGSGQPVDFIVGAVLEPNQEIKEGYSALEVTLRDGTTYQGYKLTEDKGELVLRDVLLGREVRLPATEIKERRNLGSIMPSGLVNHLTRAEFRDLIRYLSELGKQ